MLLHVYLCLFGLKDEKKQFDRSSEKYYQSLEKKLGLSNKKKESAFNEVRG